MPQDKKKPRKATDDNLPMLLPPMIPAPVRMYPAAPALPGAAMLGEGGARMLGPGAAEVVRGVPMLGPGARMLGPGTSMLGPGSGGVLPSMPPMQALPPGQYNMPGSRTFYTGAPGAGAAPQIPGGAAPRLLGPGATPGPVVYPMGPGGSTPLQVGGAPVRGALPSGSTPTSGRVFNMGGGGPGARTQIGAGGAAPRMIGPGGGGVGAGAAAARFALPSMGALAMGAGLAGAGVAAGSQVYEDYNDPMSGMSQRAFRANKEMTAARARNAPMGEKAGIFLRNAAAGYGEGLKSAASGLIPTNFIRGLIGDSPAATQTPVPAAATPAQMPGFDQFFDAVLENRARKSEGGAPAGGGGEGMPNDGFLRLNQLLPILQVMPQGGGGAAARPSQGKDLIYEELLAMSRMEAEAIKASPLPMEQKSRLLDALREKLLTSLDPNRMMPLEDLE